MNSSRLIRLALGLSTVCGLVLASSVSVAAEFVLDTVGFAKGANSSSVLIGFIGSAEITDSQVDVYYEPKAVKVSVKAFGNAGCSNPKAGLVRVVSPDTGGKALGEKMGAYCEITVTKLKGGVSSPGLTLGNAFCSGVGGAEKVCSSAVSAK